MSNQVFTNYIEGLKKIRSLVDSQGKMSNLPYTGAKNLKGEPHGKGVMRYPDGSRYEGFWINGNKEGKGINYNSKGGKTEEEWYNRNLISGNGEFNIPGEGIYYGEMKNKKRHGKGKMVFADGVVYEGEWKNGKQDGWGIYFYSDGISRYEGEWKDDQAHGKGILICPDGYKYEGEWKNDQKNGYGIQILADGQKYEGEWKNDQQNGKGTLTLPDGTKYEGEWEKGVKNGEGILYSIKGEKIEEEWQNGSLVSGIGELNIANEGTYSGGIKNGKRHGKGIQIFSEGERYEGQWENGEKNGEGTDYYDNGKIEFKGIYKNNYWFRGIYSSEDGTQILEGEFDDQGFLMNGIETFEPSYDFRLDGTLAYLKIEITNREYGSGILKDFSGRSFEGQFRKDTTIRNPIPYNGYSHGWDGRYGEVSCGNLNGRREWKKGKYSYKFPKFGNVKMIKGHFNHLGYVDGICSLTFENNQIYDGKGDGKGNIKFSC